MDWNISDVTETLITDGSVWKPPRMILHLRHEPTGLSVEGDIGNTCNTLYKLRRQLTNELYDKVINMNTGDL